MTSGAPTEFSLKRLGSVTLGDLVRLVEQDGMEAVTALLDAAMPIVASFLSVHDKEIAEYPTVIYDQYTSGVSYDPFHEQGEVLICGGPRGMLRGGEEILAEHVGFTRRTLLTILSKGLLHKYNQQLAAEGDSEIPSNVESSRLPRDISIYDSLGLPALAIEYGFTTLWDVYLEGDITNRQLRERVIQEWITWYEERTTIQSHVYEKTAYTISDRIIEADGSPREQLCYGFAIQEPLLEDGMVDVIAGP